GGWRLELAGLDAPEDVEIFARRLFGIGSQEPMLAYHDAASGQFRCAAFSGSRLSGALFYGRAPVAVSRQLVCDFLETEFADIANRWRVIAGRADAEQPDKGAIICACNGVGLNEINAAIRAGCASVEAIGASTRAGTNCGSCRAELRIMLDGQFALAAE
ncbi:MAG: (2Fe-2S)-binding protein, partial [Rhizobiaceae bacterium]